MGEVFRAQHIEQRWPVALKILNADRARNPDFRQALRQEIRAVARLYHPGVIMVFDCGEVSEALEEQSQGRFVAGSSWLAMELATYSLEDIDRDRLSWRQIKNIFLRILDALSHAHARGVIHRDLKPGNVLFSQGPEGRHLKLTDFGLAHALDDNEQAHALAHKITGTPRYMSPEQITGQWRNHGPWTDLYALGCLAFWLVSGAPPFEGDDTEAILDAHLRQPLPPLRSTVDLPEGFGPWLGRLLAKDHDHRFQRAADAARALFALGNPESQPTSADATKLVFNATLAEESLPEGADTDMGMTDILSDVVPTTAPPDLQALSRSTAQAPPRAQSTIPIPASWHRPEPPPRSTNLLGVGLGLFGLRQIPFVDRNQQRDELWSALRDVHATRRPQIVLLKGSTGTGKTRLAQWLCERAHEVGAATILRAHHSPTGGVHEGWPAMLADHLRARGLPRQSLVERVRQGLRDTDLDPDALHDCLAVTEIIAPVIVDDYSEDDARIRFRTADERHGALFSYLERLAQQRPVIAMLDDLHYGHESLQALQFLFDQPGRYDLPLLAIATINPDATGETPLVQDELQELIATSDARIIDVGPLEDDDHRQLINHLLGLEADLVDDVAQRTRGNPLHAIQLIGGWIEGDVLELGSQGFRIASGETAPHVSDLNAVFEDRLAKLLDHDPRDHSSPDLIALELAATLGVDVSHHEWVRLCDDQSLKLPLGLLDTMVAHDLATLEHHGWSFHHQAFRHILLDVADHHQRLTDHHLRCARALQSLYDDDHPDRALRVARHFRKAQRPDLALEPTLTAAQRARIRCDLELAHQLLDTYQELLELSGAADHDRRRAAVDIERAKLLQSHQDYSGADTCLQRAEALARRLDETDLIAQALLRRAVVCIHRTDLPAARALIDEAQPLFEQLGDKHGRAQALLALADLQYWEGEYYESEQSYLRSLRLYKDLDHPLEKARVQTRLGSLLATQGDVDAARDWLEASHAIFDTHGDLRGIANCLNDLGEIHRQQGDLRRAEHAYRRALDIRRRTRLGDSPIVLHNLGMVRLAQGRLADATPLFEKVRDLLEEGDQPGFLGLAHVSLLPGLAKARNWPRWDHHLRRADRLLTESGFCDTDVAALAHEAGVRAFGAGDPARARQALLLARRQWLAMGRQDRAADIDRIIPEPSPGR